MKTSLVLSRRLAYEYASLDNELYYIVQYILDEWEAKYLIATSIYRTIPENELALARTKIHCQKPHRAIDFRIKNIPGDYQRKALALARRINRRWSYDLHRPNLKVAFARAHGTGPHLHIQSHPNTRRTLSGST